MLVKENKEKKMSFNLNVLNNAGNKEYSLESDKVLSADLVLVKNAGYKNMYSDCISFKIPRKHIFKKYVSCIDYDHPTFEQWPDDILDNLGIEKKCYIDSPRYGDTLRYFFKSIEEAGAALFAVKKYIKDNK